MRGLRSVTRRLRIGPLSLLAVPLVKRRGVPAKVGVLGPAWTRGELEAPAGEKDMGGWIAAAYTAEQQARLGVDEQGNPAPKPAARTMVGGGAGSIGPAWTRGGMEAPAGEKNMGSWTAAVYTAEQQARLGVDEQGAAVSAADTINAARRRWQQAGRKAINRNKAANGFKSAALASAMRRAQTQ